MHVYFLGICGTFMAGCASLAKALGHQVSGCDENVYPPMSTVLEQAGIEIHQGYDPKHWQTQQPDIIIIGNALSRGNPMVEAVLKQGLRFSSAPQWLYENCLRTRHVIAVAGTHGKTTTTSMLSWILTAIGKAPGFLIGGVAENMQCSAALGDSAYFVIEADEYDTAFFDKRPKFMHYHPRTLIMNNLEFDHADIYADLNAIKQQFHYLTRLVPADGVMISPQADTNIQAVLDKGCYSRSQQFGLTQGDWQVSEMAADGSEFNVVYQQQVYQRVRWPLLGEHNVNNALAAIAAAYDVGVDINEAIAVLADFQSVKRRLEVKGCVNEITVYDDFAHHPTAIATTIHGLRQHVGTQSRIIAVLELSSYTLRTGVMKEQLANAFDDADEVIFAEPPGADWGLGEIAKTLTVPAQVLPNVDEIVKQVGVSAKPGDHILIMGKSAFGQIHEKCLAALK